MNERFIEIYEKNEWGSGSGWGSLDNHTKDYRDFLQTFISQNGIASVVDMGCGDWQFSRFLDWNGVIYQGYDVVPSVVRTNNERYSSPNISFSLYSGKPYDLPPADLLIVKDVLQHLPNQVVLEFLSCLPKYRYALITNCINPKGNTINEDISAGDFRYLDLRLPPFNLKAKEVFSYSKKETFFKRLRTRVRGWPKWKKCVLMVENEEQQT